MGFWGTVAIRLITLCLTGQNFPPDEEGLETESVRGLEDGDGEDSTGVKNRLDI